MDADVFRDSPARYLGYTNEVGEAFRVVLPTKAVWFTYGVASGYVACDAVDKGFRVFTGWPGEDPEGRTRLTLLKTVDALVWQSLASVIVPGFTINRLCWGTRTMLVKGVRLPGHVGKYMSVAVGLGAIPFIIKPIDRVIDHFMDLVVRPCILKTRHN
ncbi:mitochondrial fission process protein 1-like [Homalodisca vitripennis]|uniref:mitochondrial fission process protein 1-like n=1 Tax=Homalodisca vitripennis TaxID=197043 RepID=UPI001EEA0D8A|nr:mitochondrial fission process protein 1-like [Homalodisca vitripennis]KAG8327988.1 Mitochondrial fission process protein 1 [Homalodisca vitripennis]